MCHQGGVSGLREDPFDSDKQLDKELVSKVVNYHTHGGTAATTQICCAAVVHIAEALCSRPNLVGGLRLDFRALLKYQRHRRLGYARGCGDILDGWTCFHVALQNWNVPKNI